MEGKTIKEIKVIIDKGHLSDETIHKLRKDKRKGVQKLLDQYERTLEKQRQLNERFHKMQAFERKSRDAGFKYIAGVDEAGRGPLAGPVVAAAVVLPDNFRLIELTDSKQLTKDQRESFYDIIIQEEIDYHISVVSSEEIDQLNILEATKKAMTECLRGLRKVDYGLIDAVELKELPFPTDSIVKGDERSISIAAASVLAKVSRDRMMMKIHETYPEYHFDQHMGYGTKQHLDAIETYGITKEHRKSFGPVKRLL